MQTNFLYWRSFSFAGGTEEFVNLQVTVHAHHQACKCAADVYANEHTIHLSVLCDGLWRGLVILEQPCDGCRAIIMKVFLPEVLVAENFAQIPRNCDVCAAGFIELCRAGVTGLHVGGLLPCPFISPFGNVIHWERSRCTGIHEDARRLVTLVIGFVVFNPL